MSLRLTLGIGALVCGLAAATGARAQVAPDAHWRTIDTRHFHVHFTPALEVVGRRAAVDAEHAYRALAQRLHVPRGPIDLVIADNVDFSNGSTTPFPTNRIVVYAHPPLDVVSLRYYDDWLQLVITHELTHVFHLDRTRGWWRLAQRVFGRAPFLFPNQYDPAWITEGLAVFYESDITGAGRVDGTYERMLIAANAMDNHGGLLPFDRWSLLTTRFPGGDIPYGFGALFFENLATTHGDSSLREFVERSSGTTLPFFENRAARGAFGVSFQEAWRAWHDSLAAHARTPAMPMAGWRDLTHAGATAIYPRWVGDTALVYTRVDWRSSPAAARVDTAGRETRLGRRNGNDATTPTPDGALVYAQLDYDDPYRIRSDLYLQRGGTQTRLTHNARLSQPDARADGGIVAVHFLPGALQLVRVSADGRTITPLTGTSPDTGWAEPRWSPGGDRIAATRWTRGGYADVVVLDTLGRVEHTLTHDRAIDGTPTWTPDGRAVVFTSDRTGVTELYVARLDGDTVPRRFTHSPIGVYYPAVSPNGKEIAAARYADDGWHIGIAPFDTAGADTPPVSIAFAPDSMSAPASDNAPVHDYSAWHSLLPRFWLPVAGQTAHGNYSIGAFTFGNDVVDRNSYFAQLLVDPRGKQHEWDVRYQYSGLGLPLLSAEGVQNWDEQVVPDTDGTKAGDLMRRTQTYTIGLTYTRPRIRSNAFAELSGQLELRQYSTDPAPLLGRLVSYYSSNPMYYSVLLSVGWSNAQLPARAISYEDGISFAATGRLRFLDGAGPVQSQSVSAVLEGYKSLDLGGVAHQVLAARVAGGFANGADPGEYDVGGSNGTPVAVFPGFTIGSRHTFAVRGFPSGIRSGDRVLTGSLEYRIPFVTPHRGLDFWPVFLDRTAITLFSDAGTSWSHLAPGPLDGKPIASAGAELGANLGMQYDTPYLTRLGVAFPYIQNTVVQTSPATVYFEIGFSF
ncbi:MAG TPA: hypothetical protein VIC55_00630 [Gemmatimonadaceae bacterium]